jgi:hypothetical protein
MKKLSVIVAMLLLVSMVTYGATGNWEDDGDLPETWTSADVGIGTDSPESKLHLKSTYCKLRLESPGGSKWQLYARPQDGSLRFSDLNESELRLFIGSDGNVGIGTDSPDYELDVNGTIRAKEIKVETGWSDFVFADDYNLMPLDKLERHIKVNNSLPGIPTEKEVLENGVSLGDMQAKLLEKVEELTLYVIEQNKKISELEGKIAILEADK